MSVLSEDLDDNTHVSVLSAISEAYYNDLLKYNQYWSQFESSEDEIIREMSEELRQRIDDLIMKRLLETNKID